MDRHRRPSRQLDLRGAGLGLLYCGAFILLGRRRRRSIGRVWIEAANSLGLNTLPGAPKSTTWIGGPVQGVHVDIKMVPRGKNTWSTVYRATYPSTGPEVRFRPQGSLSVLRPLVGGRDVLIGDAKFDNSVVVDSTDAEAAAEFLTPVRRVALLRMFEAWKTAEVGNGSIRVETRRLERSSDTIVTSVTRVVATALLFATPSSVLEPVEEREMLDDTDRSEGPADEPLLAAEAVDVLPLDPALEEPVELTPEVTLSQQAVIDDLLGSNLMGFEIETRFANSYEGRAVTWSGEVETIRDFRNDADFGEGPGSRVSVRIGCLDNSNFVSKQVHAVFRLPADDDLDKGEDICFTGTLLRLDRYTRKICLVDARPADITTTTS